MWWQLAAGTLMQHYYSNTTSFLHIFHMQKPIGIDKKRHHTFLSQHKLIICGFHPAQSKCYIYFFPTFLAGHTPVSLWKKLSCVVLEKSWKEAKTVLWHVPHPSYLPSIIISVWLWTLLTLAKSTTEINIYQTCSFKQKVGQLRLQERWQAAFFACCQRKPEAKVTRHELLYGLAIQAEALNSWKCLMQKYNSQNAHQASLNKNVVSDMQ